MFVRLAFVVGLVTFAIVGARRVDAVLRTNSGRVYTFVHIRTSFSVSHEPVAWIASAFVLDGCVDTQLAALMHFHLKTFVNATMKGLIAAVRAIGHFIADQVLVDALTAVGAFVLAVRAGRRRSTATLSSGVGTIPFVRPVTAIILLVAVVGFGHALGVLTSKFRRRTGAVFAITFGSLIRSIAAIIVVIASPVSMDATAVTASELLTRAAVAGSAVERSRVFISSVDAIRIAIANPFTWNTLSFAPLFIGTAREFRFRVAFAAPTLVSIIFIRIVQAVVVSVADVNARDAIAVVARKQVAETSLGARFAIIWRLVGSVAAVIVSIAIPRGRNAAVVVGASETVAGTRALRTRRFVLIGIVAAVIIAVTQPERFHANVGRVAFEMLRWAGGIP